MQPTPGPDAPAPPSVRPAVPGDADAVGRVQAECWRTGLAGLVPDEVVQVLTADRFADSWHRSLTDPPERTGLLVAIESSLEAAVPATESVVGLVATGPCPDPDSTEATAELLALSVAAEHRGRGHGSRLVNAAAETVTAAGFDTLVSWVWLADEPTRALLEASGFRPDRAWRDRVVGGQGQTLRQVRLVASVADPKPSPPDGHDRDL